MYFSVDFIRIVLMLCYTNMFSGFLYELAVKNSGCGAEFTAVLVWLYCKLYLFLRFHVHVIDGHAPEVYGRPLL